MMNPARVLLGLATGIARCAYAELPLPEVSRPVFILGCGRSGTTILGTALSRHRRITFLNEPRELWLYAYPETAVWIPQNVSSRGRLVLADADVSPGKSRKIRRIFRFETLVRRRPVLVEKLPDNSLRLGFIRRIFPDARFIHIYRNGLEVARSIQGLVPTGWYGVDFDKWRLLVEHARAGERTRSLPDLCSTRFDKGLLEWRLTTEAVVGFLERLPEQDWYEFGYDELTDRPVETLSRILRFLGLETDPEVTAFASGSLARKSSRLGPEDLTDAARRIGGRLLPLSMDGGGLTGRRP